MIDYNYTYSKLAKVLGIARITMSKKIKDNSYDLKLSEIIKLMQVLHIAPDEFYKIFINENL